MSLEESRMALQRFVKNKQGKMYIDDGTEYVGIPRVWRNLPRLENSILNRLLEVGGRSDRSELRVWSKLSEIAFSDVMVSLEKNGYVIYDSISGVYRLRGKD